MSSAPVFNIAFQMVAAFIIFVTGFVALFASGVVCVAAGWILYACSKRLALLLDRSNTQRNEICAVDDPTRHAGENVHEHGQHSEIGVRISA